jgi:hypothetical protein
MKTNTVFPRLFRNALFLLIFTGYFCLAAHPAFAASDSAPCSANLDSRQLDYWLGNWTVTNANGSEASTSKVYLSLDKCLVVESWDNSKGHIGENMFAYSPGDKSWHGLFVDNQGHVHVFVDGKVESGTAEFYGPSRGPNGENVLNRIRVVRKTVNQVEQTWEKSTDNGGSWTTLFRLEYSRGNRLNP